jgi:hypothetical protein
MFLLFGVVTLLCVSAQQTAVIQGVVRDFCASGTLIGGICNGHPDFEMKLPSNFIGGVAQKGAINNTLDAYRKPIYSGTGGTPNSGIFKGENFFKQVTQPNNSNYFSGSMMLLGLMFKFRLT